MEIIIGGKKSDWVKSTVRFKLDGKSQHFEIISNITAKGYDLTTVVMVWLKETQKYTDKDFADYVNSKSHITDCAAMTIEMYEEKFK